MAALAKPFRLPPVARAALVSCSVMTTGDLVCQAIQKRQQGVKTSFDWERAARFGVIGLTLHGPYFFLGFQAIDKQFGPSPTFSSAIRKTGFGQVTLFPVYLSLFFTYLGLLEGKTVIQSVDKMKSSFLYTYATGSIFWPIANVFNFRYIPSSQRVVYVNAMGLIWNVFLSYVSYSPQSSTLQA